MTEIGCAPARMRRSVLGAALLVTGCAVCEMSDGGREAVLRANLLILRDVITSYRHDGGCVADLEQLVTSGYLRALPSDPFASDGSAWSTLRDQLHCINSVRSTSTATAIDGSRYSDW